MTVGGYYITWGINTVVYIEFVYYVSWCVCGVLSHLAWVYSLQCTDYIMYYLTWGTPASSPSPTSPFTHPASSCLLKLFNIFTPVLILV